MAYATAESKDPKSSMGGAVSSLNRAEFLRATESPKLLMDRILQYMLYELTPQDVFQMQDPDKCAKFLLLTANSLDRLFTEIDVFPVTDRGGKIYFRRVENLVKPQESNMAYRAERQRTCLAIGYFYVRILQIYLSLAFTILDDPTIVPGAGARAGISRYALPGVRQLAPGRLAIYQGIRGGAAGGAGSGDKFTFRELEEAGILRSVGDNKYKVRDSTDVIVEKRDDRQGIAYRYYDLVSRKGNATFGFELKGKGDTRKSIIITQVVRYTDRDGKQIAGIPVTKNKRFYLTDAYKLDDANLYKTVNKIGLFFQKLLEDLEAGNMTELDKMRTEEVEKVDGEKQEAKAIAARRVAAPIQGSQKVPALNFTDSLQAFMARPVAHCLARSFQLLDINALGSSVPKETTTYICRSSFMNDKDASGKPIHNVPIPDGRAITSIPGIQSLNFLYFVLTQAVQLTSETREELKTALDRLSTAFVGPESLKVAQKDLTQQSMSALKGRRPRICASRTDVDGRIGAKGIAAARAGVSKLWAYQKQHVQKVDALFKKLFMIDRSKPQQLGLAFHPELLKRGIPAVEQIAAAARNLLVDYYTNCEEMYAAAVEEMSPHVQFA